MDILSLLNMIIVAQQQNPHKISVEMIKDAIDQNYFPKEYSDVLKSIVDLVYAFCQERNYDKAIIECGKLSLLIDKYKRLAINTRY